MEVDEFQRILTVNLVGVFICSQLVVRHLLEAEKQGCIVNIASVDAFVLQPKGWSTTPRRSTAWPE